MTIDHRNALEAALATARATVATIEAALAELDRNDGDPWLDLTAAAEAVPLRRETLARWAREGRLQAVEAERGRLVTRRSWLDAALASRPARVKPAAGEDALDALLTTGQLGRAKHRNAQ